MTDTMTKPLDLADVIEGLEDIIAEWGSDAFGGDDFSYVVESAEPVFDANGIPHFPELPICAVATFAADYVDHDFDMWALRNTVGLTSEAEAFLGHVVSGVDGLLIYVDGRGIQAPENPKRDWQQGLDFALKLWGLA